MSTIFTDGTLYTQEKLDMVNACLLSIGEIPFPAGTAVEGIPEGTDGYVARKIVEDVMLEVQNRGWFFNTEYNYKAIPDSNGVIPMPPNVLRIDVGRTVNRGRIIIKNGKLWDLVNQQYWNTPITLDLIYLINFDSLPVAAFQYIALRAARKFQQRVVGDANLHTFSAQDEVDAFSSLQREHMQYRDYNLVSNTRAIMRNTNPIGY